MRKLRWRWKMPEVIGCLEYERGEQAFICPRNERQNLLFADKRTAADEKRLEELEKEEDLAQNRLKDHQATHPKISTR
jgi:hypothetical protein